MEKFIVKSKVESYDMERNEYSLDGCCFSLSSEEAALSLGLPIVGSSIFLRKRPRPSDFLSSYLCKNSRRGREQFFEGAKEALRTGDDENAARLLILLLFSTVLFPAPNQRTPCSYSIFERLVRSMGLQVGGRGLPIPDGWCPSCC